ncbi:MAG: hypothetical protein Q8L86_12385 [Vicinamibacterales bacterium]|nr:hypothetical protein [Vicinamibacterales bacterium]
METLIGHRMGYYNRAPFMVNADKHTRIVAETGTGKSVLMGDMMIEDMRAGRGLLAIDPNGTLVRRALRYVPKHRIHHVRWFDPLSDRPLGLTVLRGNTREEKLKRADQYIDTISKVFENGWGGLSDYIVRNLLYTIIEVEPEPTPAHLYLALMSEEYRDSLFGRATSENFRLFKNKFDEEWKASDRENRSAAPMNKSDIPIASWIIRDVLCQANGMDLGEEMANGSIILCDLDKGRIGPKACSLFGRFLLQEVLFAGSAREEGSKPFSLYIDELHNFVDVDALETVLQELRKRNVRAVGADQEARYIPRANFTTTIVGAVDPVSAEELAANFAKPDLAEFLTKIPAFHWEVQTKDENGVKSDPTFVKGRTPLKRIGTEYPAARAIQYSEENYGTLREKVEREINRLLAA